MSLEVNKKISDNCVITHIDENNTQDNELIAVILYVTFFGLECDVYVVVEQLKEDEPRYAMIESPSEIHASLSDVLDTEKAWTAIRESVEAYKAYIKEIQAFFES